MASSTTARAREVIAELDQFEVDMHLVNTWVHGADNLTVLLGGVSTPTIKNLVKNFRLSAQEILDAAEYIQDNYEGLEDIVESNRIYSEIADTLLLKITNWMALDLATMNRMNIDRYNDWYKHGIERIGDAGREAEQCRQNIRDLIDAFDESYAQHRLQIRLFSGTNPGASSKPVLFVISGQSNGCGYGDYTPFDQAKDCGQFWSWRDGANQLKPIADPIGEMSNRGSGWPAFARRFFALTGRKVILLNIARGGAAVTDGGSTTTNTWADNQYGNVRAKAQNIWNAFHAAVPASSYDVGAILWVQGEAEADRLYSGTVTVQDYKDGTLDIFDWTRTLMGDADCPVFFGKIGFNSNTAPAYRDAYRAIQKAEEDMCDNESIFMGFSMAPEFALPSNAGWSKYMSDGIHYSHLGYTIYGNAFARSVVNYLNF